jgi:hypothetical protein
MDLTNLANQLLFTTVRIECGLPTGEVSTGTGFVFDYDVGNTHYLFVVTNKHVIAGATTGGLTFTLRDGDRPKFGSGYRVEIAEFDKLWVGHPDAKVDIAVAALVPLAEHAEKAGFPLFFRSLNRALIPSPEVLKSLSVFEPIVFVGYPNGLWDQKNVLPIVRSGITATSPAIDFQGEQQFLVDASVFPGSSGSPVFLYNNGMYSDGKGNTTIGTRILFLGVIASVFFQNDVNPIQFVAQSPGKPATVSRQMIDLGVVFNARTVEAAIEHFAKTRGVSLHDQQK